MKVETIEQFKVLEHIKENFHIKDIKIKLIDKYSIEVEDEKGGRILFKYKDGKINNDLIIEQEEESNKKIEKYNSNIIGELKEEIKQLVDMIGLYKNNYNLVKEIIINEDKLSGEVMVRSFKTYKKVLDDFSYFCKDRKETQKDLLAMALIEFMEKYK